MLNYEEVEIKIRELKERIAKNRIYPYFESFVLVPIIKDELKWLESDNSYRIDIDKVTYWFYSIHYSFLRIVRTKSNFTNLKKEINRPFHFNLSIDIREPVTEESLDSIEHSLYNISYKDEIYLIILRLLAQ